jgi:hypothetical protein
VDEARATAPGRWCRPEWCALGRDHEVSVDECAQGPPNAGCGHSQADSEFGDSRRTLLLEGPGDALSGFAREFHNTIVALFIQRPQLEEQRAP